MLAYSSIAHAGYLLMGVVAGTTRGVSAMLIYLFIYSFMQLGAFAVIVMMRRADVVGDELKDFSGLHFRHPLAAFAMLLFMLSLGDRRPPLMGKFGCRRRDRRGAASGRSSACSTPRSRFTTTSVSWSFMHLPEKPRARTGGPPGARLHVGARRRDGLSA
jgi:ammonia channel protein AmtB